MATSLGSWKMTPEMSQNFIQLGNNLVQASQAAAQYNSYTKAIEDKYNILYCSATEYSNSLDNLKAKFEDLGYVMPTTTQAIQELVAGAGDAQYADLNTTLVSVQ